MRYKLDVKNPSSHMPLMLSMHKMSGSPRRSISAPRAATDTNTVINMDRSHSSNTNNGIGGLGFGALGIRSHQQKRVSIMTGKPMPVMPATKRSKQYRRIQINMYNFLERPSGKFAGSYQLIIFATVFLCLILSVLATIPQYEVIASQILMYTEAIIVVWLSVELSLRVWSAGCRSRYQTWRGRLKFMKNVFCILDLTVIIASISLTIIASSQNKHKNFAAAAFRGLRFFQILRMLRVDRRAGTWRLLGTVVWAHRQELITTFYIGFLSLIVSSFIMYLLEKDAEGTKIFTYADSLWWGVITLCTIGYGDVHPVTWAGKLLASCCALVGISFFALPAGILGSGFALKVQAMQRQKHLNRRRAPAATLIQCLWRCYAADPSSMSVATWKVHAKAAAAAAAAAAAQQHREHAHAHANPVNIPEYSIAQLVKSSGGSSAMQGPNSGAPVSSSFLHRVTSLKRRTPPPPPSLAVLNNANDSKSYIKTNQFMQLGANANANNSNAADPLSTSLQVRRDAIVIPGLFNAQTSTYSCSSGMNSQVPSPTPDNSVGVNNSSHNDNDSPSLGNVANATATPAVSSAVVSGGPHVASVAPVAPADVMSSTGNTAANRSNSSFIVALAAVSSREQQNVRITPIKSSFAHRTLNFLSEFNTSNLLRGSSANNADNTNANEPNGQHGGLHGNNQDGHRPANDHHPHGSKHQIQLTNQQKHAIRALRKIRYFVARRKFREALRPYDVTDVIEQYSAGNLDMLARIKTLQFRLDKILGSTKSKDCYDSNSISLASRIVKVERQMDDIDSKFDKFYKNYSLDMKLLLERLSIPTPSLELRENPMEGGAGSVRYNANQVQLVNYDRSLSAYRREYDLLESQNFVNDDRRLRLAYIINNDSVDRSSLQMTPTIDPKYSMEPVNMSTGSPLQSPYLHHSSSNSVMANTSQLFFPTIKQSSIKKANSMSAHGSMKRISRNISCNSINEEKATEMTTETAGGSDVQSQLRRRMTGSKSKASVEETQALLDGDTSTAPKVESPDRFVSDKDLIVLCTPAIAKPDDFDDPDLTIVSPETAAEAGETERRSSSFEMSSIPFSSSTEPILNRTVQAQSSVATSSSETSDKPAKNNQTEL